MTIVGLVLGALMWAAFLGVFVLWGWLPAVIVVVLFLAGSYLVGAKMSGRGY